MKGNITTFYMAKIVKNIFFQKNLHSSHVFNLHVSYPMDSHQQEALIVSEHDMFEIYFNVCGLFLFSYVTCPRLQRDRLPVPSLPHSPAVLNNAVASLLALERLHNMLQMGRWMSADLCLRGE